MKKSLSIIAFLSLLVSGSTFTSVGNPRVILGRIPSMERKVEDITPSPDLHTTSAALDMPGDLATSDHATGAPDDVTTLSGPSPTPSANVSTDPTSNSIEMPDHVTSYQTTTVPTIHATGDKPPNGHSPSSGHTYMMMCSLENGNGTSDRYKYVCQHVQHPQCKSEDPITTMIVLITMAALPLLSLLCIVSLAYRYGPERPEEQTGRQQLMVVYQNGGGVRVVRRHADGVVRDLPGFVP